ncbi:MAG TPA: Ig-like domain-containing protein [Gemmatimonadales bacterium]|nr:Ig-like domain-containing protein [Gemmatimonadales bacterium]
MVRARAAMLVALLAALLPASALAQNAVSELFVQQDSLVLKVGQREGLSVQAYDDKGDAVLNIKYLVRDEKIARVESSGTVTALAPGRTRIVIQAGKKSKTIEVIVPGVPEPVLRDLSVSPSSLTLLPTEIGHLSVTGIRVDGSAATNLRLTWKSTHPEVATVTDTSGTIVAVGAGQGTIEVAASTGPVVGVPIAVALAPLAFDRTAMTLTAGQSDTLSVVVPGQSGRRVPSSGLTWRSSDTTVALVDNTGLVRGIRSGQAEIAAAGFLQEVKVTVTVRPPIARFVLRPPPTDPVRVPLGATREFSARAEAADSTPIPGVPFAWKVADSGVATFDTTTHLLTARTLGRTTVEATTPGYKSTVWALEVVAGSVALDRSRLTLRIDSTTQLSAALIDDQGTALGPAPGVTWRSADTGVVVVDSTGKLRGAGIGSAIVTATGPGGKTASATVYVSGDLLISSSRHGGYGIYAVSQKQLDNWVPVIADGATNVQASYSPDRTRIVYSSDKGAAGNFDIWVADADGLNPQRLTSEPGLDNAPTWTPDGTHILFTSARAGKNQIYIMTAAGAEVRPVTSGAAATQEAVVSPDGKSLAYVVFREGTSGVVSRPLMETAEPTTPLAKDRRETAPRYLADGSLAWLVERKSGPARYQVVRRAIGSDSLAVLVASERPIGYFAIAPDGGRLAYVVTQPSDKDRAKNTATLYIRASATAPFVAVPGQPAENLASPSL